MAIVRRETFAVGSRYERRLDRYEQLRKRFALPRVEVTVSETEITVQFEPFPPPLGVSDLTRVAAAVAWLAALERAWGEPVGAALHEGELCFDAERRLFVVGPGLLVPSGARTEILRLGAVLGVDAADLVSFGELAAVAAIARPDLAALLAAAAAPEDSIRLLSALVDRTAGEEAVRYAEFAFRVRPTDPVLAERLTRKWLEAKRPGEPPGVRAVLEAAATGRSGSGVLLSRLARRRGALDDARRFAEQALIVSPDAIDAWKELARVAHAQGDVARVYAALSTLARAGDEAALEQLVLQGRHAEVSEVLEQWPGLWSRNVVRWRIEQLHRDEQLKKLVLTFLEHLALVEPAQFPLVREAAERIGTLAALREQLWRAVERGLQTTELICFLAEICLCSGVYTPILQLSARYPGVLSELQVAIALWEEHKYELLITHGAGNTQIAPLRLRAMIQIALETPDRFDTRAWESAARSCRAAPGGRAALGHQVEQLRRHAPRFGPLALLERLASIE